MRQETLLHQTLIPRLLGPKKKLTQVVSFSNIFSGWCNAPREAQGVPVKAEALLSVLASVSARGGQR